MPFLYSSHPTPYVTAYCAASDTDKIHFHPYFSWFSNYALSIFHNSHEFLPITCLSIQHCSRYFSRVGRTTGWRHHSSLALKVLSYDSPAVYCFPTCRSYLERCIYKDSSIHPLCVPLKPRHFYIVQFPFFLFSHQIRFFSEAD